MTTTPTPREPWDDERLRAAFTTRASRANAPADLANITMTAVRAGPARTPAWRRLLAPAAVAAVLVIGVTSGFAVLLNGDRGTTGMFRDGPTPDLKTFDYGEFAFEYPADWLGYDATVAFSGGSSIAVLGTQAVEPRCGDVAHVDINCVYEQPLEPGDVRVFVGTGALRSGTVLDRPDIENGTTTRHTVAGTPAIRDENDPQPDSFYREDLSLRWSISRPGLLSNVITIELRARNAAGSGEVVADAHAALEAVIASFWFDAAALASPADPWAGKVAVGLPVVSVSDAIGIRDAGVVDREIAVHGWFHPIPMVGCPAPPEPATSPVQLVCPDQFLWLTEAMEPVTIIEPDGMRGEPPTGPAFHPALDLVDRAWLPGLPSEGGAIPVEVVFVGHFDDYRSGLCPRAEEDACRERFVVDRVDWVNGEVQPTSVVDLVEAPPAATPFEDVRTALDGITSNAPILSAVRVDGTIGLRGIEPSLGTGQAGLIDHDALWVVRVLAGNHAATYVVVDGTNTFYEIDTTGTVTEVGATEPSSPVADTVFGKPVLSVPELLARREAPTSEEIAVRGWALRSGVIYDCDTDPDPHPLVPFCQPPVFLMEQPEMTAGQTTAGPSISMLIGPDAHVGVEIPYRDPVDVIAIGHFLDHRWPTCPGDEQAACQVQFVVDRVVGAGQNVLALPQPWRLPGSSADPTDDPTDVIARLQETLGEVTAISIGHLDPQLLHDIEPDVWDSVDFDFVAGEGPQWLVRVVFDDGSPPVARTFIVSDPSGSAETIWEATDEGFVPSTRPADPWPPADATVIELGGPVGAGRPRPRVAVVDLSGRLTSVREVRDSDPPVTIIEEGDRAGLGRDRDGAYRLRWTGGVCDGELTVTIAADLRGIVVDGGRQTACDSMGIGRELVLQFSQVLDPADVDVVYTETRVPDPA